jgi:hypothetical protein
MSIHGSDRCGAIEDASKRIATLVEFRDASHSSDGGGVARIKRRAAHSQRVRRSPPAVGLERSEQRIDRCGVRTHLVAHDAVGDAGIRSIANQIERGRKHSRCRGGRIDVVRRSGGRIEVLRNDRG